MTDPTKPLVLVLLIAAQAFCAVVFVGDVMADLFGTAEQEPEGGHAYFEALATLALIAAILVEIRILLWLLRRKAHLEQALSTAQSAVQEVIDAELDSWQLTPAERDVANFLIKGLNTGEIAAMRGSAEGTVKAQLNAIYRKSGCANRAELMSQLIDTLMGQRSQSPSTG
ncbi:helix-turn-helix transcriptional regulator [Pseudophaeobacter sp.]|uniref:helix-turn-helix transcriptional regulator n=1 Tax=Pseudophaeobacter sp. TaxID=1971739 RepID=UPI003296D06A